MRLAHAYGDGVPFPSMASREHVRNRSCGRYNMAQKQMLPGDACNHVCRGLLLQAQTGTARRQFDRAPARMRPYHKVRKRAGADTNRQRRLQMDKIRRALQVLLCVGSPWVIGVASVHAAEGSASTRESASANAAPSNEALQREWREKLRRSPAAAQANALFETRSWLPEPPLPRRPVARAPEPPTPPPFPYQFLGRLETDGKPRTIYLTKDNQVYSVAPGEVIEGTYRVVDVTPESMEVTYLPLNMKQQIAFSSIVPTVGRQASRASDTPSIVAPTTVPIPPSVSEPSRVIAPRTQSAPVDTSRSSQRQNNPEQAPVNRGSAGQQQTGAAPPTGASPAANPASAAAPPSLSPSPVVVSPPTLSAFGAKPPSEAPPAGATSPAPAPSGATAPSAASPGRM